MPDATLLLPALGAASPAGPATAGGAASLAAAFRQPGFADDAARHRTAPAKLYALRNAYESRDRPPSHPGRARSMVPWIAHARRGSAPPAWAAEGSHGVTPAEMPGRPRPVARGTGARAAAQTAGRSTGGELHTHYVTRIHTISLMVGQNARASRQQAVQALSYTVRNASRFSWQATSAPLPGTAPAQAHAGWPARNAAQRGVAHYVLCIGPTGHLSLLALVEGSAANSADRQPIIDWEALYAVRKAYSCHTIDGWPECRRIPQAGGAGLLICIT